MALQPSLSALIIAGEPNAPHTLEFFLDYVCPFSAKISFAIERVVRPLLGPGGKYHGKVKAIFRPQVQPWHASSTLTHEAGLAAARVSPETFWTYALALFKSQSDFFDIPTSTLTPIQIRNKLCELGEPIFGAEKVAKMKDLLVLKSTPNGGNVVTDDLKYTIKFSRQNGIHVSPTVLWDGLIVNEASSSWAEQEWADFFSAKVSK